MVFSMNSRYALQRVQWIPPTSYIFTCLKVNEKTLSTKGPKEDASKASLRLNIPKDSPNVEPYSKLIKSAQPRSKSLISKSKKSYTPGIEDGLLCKSGSEMHFSSFRQNDDLEKSTHKQETPPQTAVNVESSEQNPEQAYYPTVNHGYYGAKDESESKTESVNNVSEQSFSEMFPETLGKDSANVENAAAETDEAKNLYIVIDAPEKEKEKQFAYVDTCKPVGEELKFTLPSFVKDDFDAVKALSGKSMHPKMASIRMAKRKFEGLKGKALQTKISSLKGEKVRNSPKVKYQVHEIDDASTYVFQLKFKKGLQGRTCAVGYVPEKEINTRKMDSSSPDSPLDFCSGPECRNRSLREVTFSEDRTEYIKFPDWRTKGRNKKENPEKSKTSSMNAVNSYQNPSDLSKIDKGGNDEVTGSVYNQSMYSAGEDSNSQSYGVSERSQTQLEDKSTGHDSPTVQTQASESVSNATAEIVSSTAVREESADNQHSKMFQTTHEPENVYATHNPTQSQSSDSPPAQFTETQSQEPQSNPETVTQNPTTADTDTWDRGVKHRIERSRKLGNRTRSMRRTPSDVQTEAYEPESTDFHTTTNVVRIQSERPPTPPRYSAGLPNIMNKTFKNQRKGFGIIERDSMFGRKWSHRSDFDTEKKGPTEIFRNPLFFSTKETGEINAALFKKKDDILHVYKGKTKEDGPKITDNMVNVANENLTEDKGKTSVDSLAMMKQLKEIVDFDLKNAVKIFEGREAQAKVEEKVEAKSEPLTSQNQDAVETFDGRKETAEMNHEPVISPKYLPGRSENDGLSEVERKSDSVIDFDLETEKFVVNMKQLENAIYHRRENFDETYLKAVCQGLDTVLSNEIHVVDVTSPIHFECKSGDSILIFDETTQTWKVDYSILEKRRQQIKEEEELTRRSEMILETFEKLEQGKVTNVPKPSTRDRKTFDYNKEEWKVYRDSEQDEPVPKSSKPKLPFKESDAEEIRKRNSDLYDDLFIANKKNIDMTKELKDASETSEPKKIGKSVEGQSEVKMMASGSKKPDEPCKGDKKETPPKEPCKEDKKEEPCKGDKKETPPKEPCKEDKKEEPCKGDKKETPLKEEPCKGDKKETPPKEPCKEDKKEAPPKEEPCKGDKKETPSKEPFKGEKKETTAKEPSTGDKKETTSKEPCKGDKKETPPKEQPCKDDKKETPPKDPCKNDNEQPKKPTCQEGGEEEGWEAYIKEDIPPLSSVPKSRPTGKAPTVAPNVKKIDPTNLKVPPLSPDIAKITPGKITPPPKSGVKVEEPKFRIPLPFGRKKKIEEPKTITGKSDKVPPITGGIPGKVTPTTILPDSKITPTKEPPKKLDPKSKPPTSPKGTDSKPKPPPSPPSPLSSKTADPGTHHTPASAPPKTTDPKIPPPVPSSRLTKDSKSKLPSSITTNKDHYVSDNIVEMSKNAAKDKNSTNKSKQLETVKLNITSDTRTPSKITEINLNKKFEDKTKETSAETMTSNPNDTKKALDEVKNNDKCSIENKTFYRNFEKYKTPFADPEFEEKPVKINSDMESNPNLKKLDNWNKTLVLHDTMKPSENVESWLKDETDKMATLLLKVLQEAADGKPKRKSLIPKGKLVEKTGKANPYDNIRKKQENTPEGFLFKVRTVNFALGGDANSKPTQQSKAEKKTDQDNSKEIPVQSAKTAKSTKVVEVFKMPEISVSETSTGSHLPSLKKNSKVSRAYSDIILREPKSKLPDVALDDLNSPWVGRDVETKLSVDLSDDIPGPEILKKISGTWKMFPVIGCQATIFTLLRIFQLVNLGTTFWNTSTSSKPGKNAFSNLFTKYGPIVNLQGPLSGNIVLMHKPEHVSGVFEQDTGCSVRSVFDSLEQSRREAENKILTVGISTDWSKTEWNDLKKASNDPLVRGCEKFFRPVEVAGESLISNIRRNRNNQNLVSDDFMREIKQWSLEGLCTVLFEKSFGFLEGRNNNTSWLLEPEKFFSVIEEATECLSKCERGFQAWRLISTPSSINLNQAYRSLYTILSKQLYQAELNLKHKNEHLKDNSFIGSHDLTFLESMLLNDRMTVEDIICNLVDFLLIGVNTMSSALGFMLYNLAQNVKVQGKLLKEVKEMLPDKTSRLDYHKLHSLKYLQACLKESLRLNSPVPVFFRVLQNDVIVSNYVIPKETYVVMDYKFSNMKEQNFEDPEKFTPERWLNDEKWLQDLNPLSSLPFCHGPRAELAKRVVEMQLWSCIARIVRNFQIEYHYGEIQGTDKVFSHPDKPLKLNFVERDE